MNHGITRQAIGLPPIATEGAVNLGLPEWHCRDHYSGREWLYRSPASARLDSIHHRTRKGCAQEAVTQAPSVSLPQRSNDVPYAGHVASLRTSCSGCVDCGLKDVRNLTRWLLEKVTHERISNRTTAVPTDKWKGLEETSRRYYTDGMGPNNCLPCLRNRLVDVLYPKQHMLSNFPYSH